MECSQMGEQCEKIQSPGSSTTRLLLDVSESLSNPPLPALEPLHFAPWIEDTLPPQITPSRKKRTRRKRPVNRQSRVVFCKNDHPTLTDQPPSLTFPTCYMKNYIIDVVRNRAIQEKADKSSALIRPEYRLSSRERERCHGDRTLPGDRAPLLGDKEKSMISTQSPCLLDKSCLAWSGSDQLPKLQPEKKLSVDSMSSRASSSHQEVVMLFKSRDFYSANQNTELAARDFHLTNHVPSTPPIEIPSRDFYSSIHNTEMPPRDYEACLASQNKLLPSVKNCRVTWNWRAARLPTTPIVKLTKPESRDLHVLPLPAHRLDLLTRSSSASSRSSATMATEFKGKLQNFLHRSSDSCFKKLPCGLVYGKSLRGKTLRRVTRNSAIELCVRPV